MHKLCIIFASALAIACSSFADGIERSFEVNSRVGRQTELKPVFHGEEITISASFYSDNDGTPFLLPSGDWSLYYQTNGMGKTFFAPIPATVTSNTVSAVFNPTNDPGAVGIVGFLGKPGSNYHAAFKLRLLDSPGFTPSEVSLPVQTLNFDAISVLNPPYYTQTESDTKYVPWTYGSDKTLTADGLLKLNYAMEVAPLAAIALYDLNNIMWGSAASGFTYLGDYLDGISQTASGSRSVLMGGNMVSDVLAGDCLTSNGSMVWQLDISGKTNAWTKRVSLDLSAAAKASLEKAESALQPGDVPDWAMQADKPSYSVGEISGAASSSAVSSLQSQVTVIGAHLNAEDSRFVVTNYNSTTKMGEASAEVKIDDNWIVIWREMTRWNWFLNTYLPTNYYTKTEVYALLDDKADRAWGFYDSHTGNYAPDGYTWISSPYVAISGGLAYQRTITAEGAVWVLESNGLVTETGGTVSNGFFRISDDEGGALFEIIKGDKRTVGATAGSVRQSNAYTITHLYISYPIDSAEHPTLEVCTSLTLKDWEPESSADCAANVTWTGSRGNWEVEVWGKTANTQLFIKATYETGGETYIRNNAPVGMSSIMLNGVKYNLGTATISGNTVLTLTPES